MAVMLGEGSALPGLPPLGAAAASSPHGAPIERSKKRRLVLGGQGLVGGRCYHCKGSCERAALELLQGGGFLGVGKVRVVCVGDSITSGVCSGDIGAAGYPAHLQRLLGERFVVTNLGACGTSVQLDSDSPYQQRVQWQAALRSRPDVVVLMLGTNDARPVNWGTDKQAGVSDFAEAYRSMIRILQLLPSSPVILPVVPPPFYNLCPQKPEVDQLLARHVTGVVNEVLPALVPKISREAGLPHALLDAFTALGGAGLARPDLSADGCHPNDAGYLQLALAVHAALDADERVAAKVLEAETAAQRARLQARALQRIQPWPAAVLALPPVPAPAAAVPVVQVPSVQVPLGVGSPMGVQAWPPPVFPPLLQTAAAADPRASAALLAPAAWGLRAVC